MSIDTYRAPTMRDALERVRRAVGGDAVILDSRQVSVDPPLFEVVARTEETASEEVVVATLEPEAPPVLDRGGLYDELASLRERLDRMNGWLLADTPPEFSIDEKRMHVRLVETGLDARLAAAIIRRSPPETELARGVWDTLSDAVPVRGAPPRGTRRVVALIGATGVGKTTTAAKLASRAVLTEGRSAALITTDDRRVGAGAPLSFYANVLDIPFARVNTPTELTQVLAALSEIELVIVDTAGQSGRCESDTCGLERWLGESREIEPWLVLSAASGTAHNLDTLRGLASVEPEATVVTKLDEATRPGEVGNVLIRSHLPLSFVSTGPGVPDDLEPATRSTLPRLLLDPTGR